MHSTGFIIMRILEIAGAMALIALGVSWLALLWKTRSKLSAIEKELSGPKPAHRPEP